VILNSEGIDITAQVSGGKLGGLLDYRNRVLGSVRGDAYRQGDLNRLAQGIADRVNTILTSGNISDGPPAVPGVPLFTYGSADGTGAAGTLSVNPDITVNQLAAIAPGPPYSTNGTALALAGLAVPTDPADKLDKLSFTQFYGSMASRIGSQLSTARNSQTLHQNLVNQARSQREDISGVSLDEEAIRVLEFQRSYQAAAKMVAVLDELTQTMVNLIR
jgi:flagellar hook-associated protein 1 FlgK